MSVTEVIAQLRQAHALITQARQAALQADAAITDGADVFAAATLGSTQPEVDQINHLAARSAEEVRAAHALLGGAQEIIDGYCHDIAGHGIGVAGGPLLAAPATDDTATRPPPPTGPPTTVDEHTDPQIRYADEIAELRRRGAAVKPHDVVRAERLDDGRIIWIENGDDDSGRNHIFLPDRVRNFEEVHIPREEIEGLLFAAIRSGTVVGHCGRDRPVYEVEYLGERRRVAINTTAEGKIYGANPISRRRKLRRDLHRK
ncbi:MULTISPECIES: hypothetical protein [Actinoalloteichus]|uniref:DUF4258 domain-containing protein n=1 Tax=Actinoalloteichus fjordicus TaxID=1612552 RepID=A0AAC9PTS9_9PSEU|nr:MULTISPECIES: hypothetical protein [Actinoalloteichus]APU16206.1 hypothetical protein UA74_20905 [Actinoalloteichus fjordicus]APU22267.1 hypothetical protein UA75_21390 [Actinoalloteichus sp. GBA129-24]